MSLESNNSHITIKFIEARDTARSLESQSTLTLTLPSEQGFFVKP